MFQLGGRNSLFPTQVKHSRTESAVIQTHTDTSSRETDLILQNQHLYAKDYKCYFLLISFLKIKIKYNTKANGFTPSQKGRVLFSSTHEEHSNCWSIAPWTHHTFLGHILFITTYKIKILYSAKDSQFHFQCSVLLNFLNQ